jgi:hypothetical protein
MTLPYQEQEFYKLITIVAGRSRRIIDLEKST